MRDHDPLLESFYPGARILVVEEDETSSSVVINTLKHMGHEPVPCASAETALEIIDRESAERVEVAPKRRVPSARSRHTPCAVRQRTGASGKTYP